MSERELREALQAIVDGDVPRPAGRVWRRDGKPSKLDECVHSKSMSSDCADCIEAFAAAALSSTGEAEGWWEGMEDAPKDMTLIIGQDAGGDVFSCAWFPSDDDGPAGWLSGGTDEVFPARWIPMPKRKEGEGNG